MIRSFMAYENEEDSFMIADLTIENRLDRITLYGSLDLTKDKVGLKYALELKRVVDAAVDVLKHIDIPDRIEIQKPETLNNPFV